MRIVLHDDLTILYGLNKQKLFFENVFLSAVPFHSVLQKAKPG